MSEERANKKDRKSHTGYLVGKDTNISAHRFGKVYEKHLNRLKIVYFDLEYSTKGTAFDKERFYRFLARYAYKSFREDPIERRRKADLIRRTILFPVLLLKPLIEFFSFGPNTIRKAPGYRILEAAEFLCGPKTIDQVFEPLVADWQEEYFVALNENRWFKARWISIRYMWKALLAFGLSKLFAAVRAFSTKR